MTSSFHDTRWTLVSRSRGSEPEARAALSELCEAYYAPVVSFLRRDGRDEDTARELAHDFFARLLAGGAMENADPQRGRFRSYLLAALKHFAADQREKAVAAKRGGGQKHDSLDASRTTDATGAGLQIADANAAAPDAAFDRQWALTVLARALATLEADMRASGKADHFDILKPWLTTDDRAPPQAQAAARLGISEDAVKVAIHRLRKRFRDAVKAEVAQTVNDPKGVDEELDSLKGALR